MPRCRLPRSSNGGRSFSSTCPLRKRSQSRQFTTGSSSSVADSARARRFAPQRSKHAVSSGEPSTSNHRESPAVAAFRRASPDRHGVCNSSLSKLLAIIRRLIMAKWKFAVGSRAEPVDFSAASTTGHAHAAAAAVAAPRRYRAAGPRAGALMDNPKGWRVTFLSL